MEEILHSVREHERKVQCLQSELETLRGSPVAEMTLWSRACLAPPIFPASGPWTELSTN